MSANKKRGAAVPSVIDSDIARRKRMANELIAYMMQPEGVAQQYRMIQESLARYRLEQKKRNAAKVGK